MLNKIRYVVKTQHDDLITRIERAKERAPETAENIKNLVLFAEDVKNKATLVKKEIYDDGPERWKLYIDLVNVACCCNDLIDGVDEFVEYVLEPATSRLCNFNRELEEIVVKERIHFYISPGTQRGDRKSIRAFRDETLRFFQHIAELSKSKATRLTMNIVRSFWDVVDAESFVHGFLEAIKEEDEEEEKKEEL